MRTFKSILLGVAVFAAMLAPATSHAACADTFKSTTAAGSTKTDCGEIQCGNTGTLPTGNPGGVRAYANTTSDGAELEACNDQGPGNTQGRLVMQLSSDPAHPGMRVVLDTDDGQPFDPGYIVVQVSSVKPGIYCNKEGKNPADSPKEDTKTSDGYYHQWGNPGTQSDPSNCIPVVS